MAVKQVYRITFQDDGRGASSPEINRVRSVLKQLLRTFGFKALRVELQEDEEESRESDRVDLN